MRNTFLGAAEGDLGFGGADVRTVIRVSFIFNTIAVSCIAGCAGIAVLSVTPHTFGSQLCVLISSIKVRRGEREAKQWPPKWSFFPTPEHPITELHRSTFLPSWDVVSMW